MPRDFAIEYRRVIGGEKICGYYIRREREKEWEKKEGAHKTPKLLHDKKRRRFSLGSAVSAISGTSQSKLRAINCNKDARNRHSGFFAIPRSAICIFMLALRSTYATLLLSSYNESRGWTATRCYLFFALRENLSNRAILRSFTSCVIPTIDRSSAKCVIKLY